MLIQNLDQKYFISVVPVDGWNEWHVEVITEDLMSPFLTLWKNSPDQPYKTYEDALNVGQMFVEYWYLHRRGMFYEFFPTLSGEWENDKEEFIKQLKEYRKNDI